MTCIQLIYTASSTTTTITTTGTELSFFCKVTTSKIPQKRITSIHITWKHKKH